MKLARVALFAAALVAAVAAIPSPAAEEGSKARLALTIEIDGAIGPATAKYVNETLAIATERHAEVVILRLRWVPFVDITGLQTLEEVVRDLAICRRP